MNDKMAHVLLRYWTSGFNDDLCFALAQPKWAEVMFSSFKTRFDPPCKGTAIARKA